MTRILLYSYLILWNTKVFCKLSIVQLNWLFKYLTKFWNFMYNIKSVEKRWRVCNFWKLSFRIIVLCALLCVRVQITSTELLFFPESGDSTTLFAPRRAKTRVLSALFAPRAFTVRHFSHIAEPKPSIFIFFPRYRRRQH